MINKFKVAFLGLKSSFLDKSILLQMILGIVTIIVFNYLKISYLEWLAVIILIGVVIMAEIFNTCIERICDLYDSKFNQKIKYIKDLSSGGVLLICIFAAAVAIIIIIKHIGG